MESVSIQKVELIHVAELISIGKQTFYETFAMIIQQRICKII